MTQQAELNLCLIGCGHMGRLHARNLAFDARVARLTLCDASEDTVTALVDDLSGGSATLSPGQVDTALDGAFDGFIIASPAHLHLEQVIRASKTGAYIFCEKPLGTDFAAIEAATAALAPYAEQIQVGFNRRFDPQMAALKARIAAGDVGPIEQLHIVSRDHRPPTIAQLKNSAGLIAETAIHDFDMLRWLLDGEIAQISCYGGALINPEYADHGHIDTATMVLISEIGQQIVIQNSWRAANGYDQRIEAFGPKGRLTVDNPTADLVRFEGRSGMRHGQIADDWSTRYIASYCVEMQAFVHSVAKHQSTMPNLCDAIAASKLAFLAQRSLREGRAIDF